MGIKEMRIKECLTKALNPVYLEIKNESYMHNVPKDSETHFKVLIVSDNFKNVNLINRHRTVNKIVKDELKEEFPHAFSIVAKDTTEYDKDYKLEESAPCRGGFGK